MSVAQKLAHCNVAYEMVYENIHPKLNAFIKFLLKLMVKNAVVTEKPYKNSTTTVSSFIIKEERYFETEKNRLMNHISKTQQLGAMHFDQSNRTLLEYLLLMEGTICFTNTLAIICRNSGFRNCHRYDIEKFLPFHFLLI